MTRKLPFSTTYELRIFIRDPLPMPKIVTLKDRVREWLIAHGEESFVEGVVEGIDLEYNYEAEDHDNYHTLGGDLSPISIYKYDEKHLVNLKTAIEKDFEGRIYGEIYSTPTEIWQEGWKQSFQPIETDRFYIYPPWERTKQRPGKVSVEIDPGMAFGTGQHETTQLCLRELESLMKAHADPEKIRLLDVGTGSGILAIAAAKLGIRDILATDIDGDAVAAAQTNAERNHVRFAVAKASVPADAGEFDLVIANILAVILRRLAPQLVKATKIGGHLILSGVLSEENEVMIKIYEDLGMKFLDKLEMRDWSSLVFKKRG